MKLKRRRTVEVPLTIKSFINNVISTPLENIEGTLRGFSWEFDKGDFHHWVDLFNHFNTFFEKCIKPRKDLQLADDFYEYDDLFPRDAVLQILRVIRIILENCTNKHFPSSYEHHLSSLLASTDADVVEACLQTLAAFLKKSIVKFITRDAALNSRLFSFAQGWGGKQEGLGLVSCSLENITDPITFELGSTLHFEFYSLDESSDDPNSTQPASHGLNVIHMPDVSAGKESDLELLKNLVHDYKVPQNLRFSLLTRLRFARAFTSLASRMQYTCIRLYAFVVLVQACGDADDLVSFFNAEPEFINELVTLLSYEDAVSEKIRILSLLSLVALCQDRSRQSTVLTAVTSGGHRGILSSLMQKAIDSVVNDTSKSSVVFAEALLSLVTVLVSSSSGCSALREAGFIPTLLPLLKDTNAQHLHLVSTAVHVLEAFMDYSNPAAALFRDLGGLDGTISRLMIEVSSDVDTPQSSGSPVIGNNSAELDNLQPLYSEALVSYHRRLLMKALLRAISLGTYAPGTTSRMCESEQSLLPHCLCMIFKRAKEFGGGVFSLAATVMSDLIHKDPTCYSILETTGLPSAFLDAIMDGVLCSSEAITCIPQCLDALCLNNSGLKAVKERNALRCFVKVFTSKSYLRVLNGDTAGSLSSGLDELMRHAVSLRVTGIDMLIEILDTIAKIGSGLGSTSADSLSHSQPVSMETEPSGERDAVLLNDSASTIPENLDQQSEPPDSGIMNVESFLPDCISNTARLLETILQNSDICRIFAEKKGIECVLQLLTLPSVPPSVSLGQTLSIAFKNFSPQHSNSLARAVCAFLKEHLKSMDEVVTSITGSHLVQMEISKRGDVLRPLSNLESILALCSSLLKGSTMIFSELGSADLDVLKDLGKVYKEILWQVSLSIGFEVEEKQNVEVVAESSEGVQSNVAGRDSDDDANVPSIRYMNPLSIRNSFQSHWGNERDFISVVRSGEGFSRRSRASLARLRGTMAGRLIEAFQIDSDAVASNSESSSRETKKRTPEMLVVDILNKLASTMRSFFTALVKSLISPNRRRTESGSLASASKNIGAALAKIFVGALGFAGHSSSNGLDISLSVKCQYLGKVVGDMAALTYDSRRRTCYAFMINNFYVNGTFKELLTTFEATCQLLWNFPNEVSSSATDIESSGGRKLTQSSWLLDTLQSHCRALEYFVDSGLLLSSTSESQAQLLVQPVEVGLSIGLFPIPKDAEVFVRMLQTQVLDVILPVWNHPMFPNCDPGFVTSIISLMTHVYNGVSDMKQQGNGTSSSANQRFVPPPDEATIATIVEMGFSRARAEEALRRVETNSVERAMEWLFSHAEDPVQEDDELARALALSLGSSSETHEVDGVDRSTHAALPEVGHTEEPSADGILAAAMKLCHSSDSMAFSLTDLLLTLCRRNKGTDRAKVISYLVQQLKLCTPDFANDTSEMSVILHTLALILSEDVSTREIAAQDGLVSIAIKILLDFLAVTESSVEFLVPRCISGLLLILDDLVQFGPKVFNNAKGPNTGPSSGSLTHQISSEEIGTEPASDAMDKDDTTKDDSPFENILGKPTGYLTMEESRQVLNISYCLIKRHVPPMVMQAVFQLSARLTKSHVLAVQFLETGGLVALFGIPRESFFPGYDTLASAIVRHLLEDPQTLQTAMESEIRQTLSGNRHAGRLSVRAFLTSLAPVITRDPVVFMRAVIAVCQFESSGGRSNIVLAKDKEKLKVSGAETVAASGEETVRISEGKAHDGSYKSTKGHKKMSTNLTQVIDYLIEIVSAYPSYMGEEDSAGHQNAMDVDEPTVKSKGKSKVGETAKTESDVLSDKSAQLAKVSFVLKLLSDILMMYAQAAGVILRRDLEMCQSRLLDDSECSVKGGIICDVLHRLLPLSVDNSTVVDEWKNKLSENASWFLVVLAGRSSEGRKRVVNELVKALSVFVNVESNSSNINLVPNKKLFALVDLLYSILSKISPSSNLPGSGCSPDVAKTMIEGGVMHCLSGILQAIDLDHPEAPKVVNPILKSLESLTRAANRIEQVVKADAPNKKKTNGLSESSDAHHVDAHSQELRYSEYRGHQEGVSDNAGSGMQGQDQNMDQNQSSEQETRTDEAQPTDIPVDLGVDYMHEDIEGGGALSHTEQYEMSFHVQDRVDDDMNDEEDDMGDDGEDDEDDDDAEDEDEDIAEDGTGLMSLADTDVEDNDETGLGDEYSDDMVDEDHDDFHDNRVIEVRWREALDGLEHLEVFRQSGTGGLFNISAEPFEGVEIDDFFGIRRSFGFERRRQANRTSNERSVAEGNELQHPLLSRPPHSGDFVSILSAGGNSSRGSEGLSAGSLDLASFYMFDAPVLRYENNPPANLLGDRLGGSAFSIGLDSVRVSGRRGPGDGRWTDNGQPQAGGHATAVAQAVEDHFISQLCNSHPTENAPEILLQNPGAAEEREGDPPVATDQLALGGSGTDSPQVINMNNDDGNVNGSNNGYPNAQPGEIGPSLEVNNVSENVIVSEGTPSEIDGDGMDIGEENATGGETLETSSDLPIHGDHQHSSVPESVDVEMNAAEERDGQRESNPNSEVPNGDGIDPTFLDALPEDLRAEVIASQQAQTAPAPAPAPSTSSTVDDIDPEFLAALPPDIQAEVLAQQRAQRIMQQSEGQPVDMDNASIIATLPADIREEVLLTSSEAVLSALPSSLLAEAQMLRDRVMSHYQARGLFGGSRRLGTRGNRFGFDRHTMLDRGVGLTIGRTPASIGDSLKLKELEGEPLLDANGLKALIQLLRLAQPLGKGLLKRLLLNLCSHGYTRATLVHLLLDVLKPESIGVNSGLTSMNSLRLYGCQSDVVYSQSQVCNGVPPLVLRRALEILTYMATNHAGVSSLLFHFEGPSTLTTTDLNNSEVQDYKGKGKVSEDEHHHSFSGAPGDGHVPLILLLKLLRQPLFMRSISHLEQVMSLIQVVVYAAASKVEDQSSAGNTASPENPSDNNAANDGQKESHVQEGEHHVPGQCSSSLSSHSDQEGSAKVYDIFLKIPQSDLCDLCSLLGREGLSDKIYTLVGEVLTKLASVAAPRSKFFISKLSESAQELSSYACNELVTLRKTHMLGLNAGAMAGSAVLRVLQILSSLTSVGCDDSGDRVGDEKPEEHATMHRLNVALEPLWKELSECISTMELGLSQSSQSSVSNNNFGENVQGSLQSPPLLPGTQRLLPFIEGFFVLCEKLQANNQLLQQDQISATAREVKESAGSSSVSSIKSVDSYVRADASITFLRFAEKHRRILNAFVRQNPTLLEKSLSLMLKAPRLIDFDNKRAYFRSRIRQQNDQQLSGSLRINVRRAYILEDSYNQLRMRSSQDLRGRLNVHFQGEEGIDAGGLTREWYQLLSRVIFDKGALLFTTVGNNVTFQPNPNSVYQTEHLSYFKFIGRMVAKALYDGQLLDVYFTRSFYKHILGVKVTYHDIEAVDPDYYKNLKWMLENDVSDIPDLTFSMDADEEKHILYEKTEVTDYELKPGGRNIRVTEETKHEYVDLVADHILTNAIRPQINAFLEGFNELVPRELISIFNDRELELCISGLPEIDLDDLKANTEYTGYTVASSAIQWFWEVAREFSKEDRARLLQFVTGTSKVPLEGFKALQGISGPQRFQIHKAYGAPERLPSAHTCFNQLDLPEYSSKEQLQERLLLAIHEGSEGFGFG